VACEEGRKGVVELGEELEDGLCRAGGGGEEGQEVGCQDGEVEQVWDLEVGYKSSDMRAVMLRNLRTGARYPDDIDQAIQVLCDLPKCTVTVSLVNGWLLFPVCDAIVYSLLYLIHAMV
jgi:hypothetical protein